MLRERERVERVRLVHFWLLHRDVKSMCSTREGKKGNVLFTKELYSPKTFLQF